MISTNMIATMKEITPHVTCGRERTKIMALAFSIIKIPHHCSLATERFAIKPYKCTTDLSISESIDFLKISYGKNSSQTKMSPVLAQYTGKANYPPVTP